MTRRGRGVGGGVEGGRGAGGSSTEEARLMQRKEGEGGIQGGGPGVTLRAPGKERARAIYGTVALTSHRVSRSHLDGRIWSAQATGGVF